MHVLELIRLLEEKYDTNGDVEVVLDEGGAYYYIVDNLPDVDGDIVFSVGKY